jgi:rhodanese-related sulfurtransferase
MKTAFRALVIAAAALAAGLAANWRHPEGIPPNLLGATLFDRAPLMRITPDSARALWSAGAASFIDIRPVPEFGLEHVPGAENRPFRPFFGEFDEFKRNHPTNRTYVFYCFEPVCREGRTMLRLMRRNGYDRAVWMHGGLSEWMGLGLPIETGWSAP